MSTATPFFVMISALRSISPCVWLRSGDRFKVQLMNSARRPSNRHGSAASSLSSVIAVPPLFHALRIPGAHPMPGRERGLGEPAWAHDHGDPAVLAAGSP